MRHRILFLVVTTTLLASTAMLAAPAWAQSLDAIVESVEFRGYYVEPGAEGDIDELERTMAGIEGVVVVVLADDPSRGADLLADDVRAELDEDVSVLVVSPGEVGAVSDVVDDSTISSALDGVIDDLDNGRSVAEATSGFASVVDASVDPDAAPIGDPAPTVGDRDTANDTESSADGGGGGSGVGLLVILGLIAVAIGGFVLLSRRRARKGDDVELTSARAEINAQLAAVAAEIVDNEAAVGVSENERAIELFRDANATYNAVSEQVEVTTDLRVLAELNDRVDKARWQLEASEALVAGRTPPPEPAPDAPAACFFDPTHRPGTEAATIRTGAGDKVVGVCRACAAKLERGEQPEPRMVEVGGRRVPAAKAPRSHGGLGMGGLSVFEIILGGLAALGGARGRGGSSVSGTGIDWGDMLPGRSGGSRRNSAPASSTSSSPFGIDRLPTRSGRMPSLPSSGSSGPSSRGTAASSPKGPAMGRGRRRR